MVGIALSYTTIGIDAQQISVEADNSNALYGVNIVGMASSAVKESKDRIFAALKNSGYSSYDKRYTINLAPADIKKDSSALDLPIAISVLQSNNVFRVGNYRKVGIVGELSLDGNVRPISGVLPIALAAKRDNLDTLIVTCQNAS